MAFNYNAFFTSASKVRGGKFVWVKDASNMNRRNVPFGSTIANPYKGVGYAWAGDLYEYHVDSEGYLFRSFAVAAATANDTDTTISLNGDGYSCVPEVGMLLMKAPSSLTIENYATSSASGTKQKVKITFTAGCSTAGNLTIGLDGTETAVAVTTGANTPAAVAALVGAATFPNYTVAYTGGNAYVEFTAVGFGERAAAVLDAALTGVTGTVEETIAGKSNVVKTVSDYTGQSGKVTAVAYDASTQRFSVTVDVAIGGLLTTDILVEAAGTVASAAAKPLVTNPNTFVEVDTQFMPSDPMYGIDDVTFQINTVYGLAAWIDRMQPLPKYVLAKNRSYIDGIFEI